MFETWVPITIAAAFFQNVRSSLQKHLKGSLSTSAAAYVRFFYALPFVLLYLAILHFGAGYDFPEFNRRFLFFAVLGSTAQIAGTALLIHLLRVREPGQLTLVCRTWRISGAVGLAGMSASACWFTAMTIRNAAHVKALGQVELLFAFVVSAAFFRERVTGREVLGVLLVVTGILALLLRG